MENNLFKKAITKKQLYEFAMGLNDYFIPDREYGGHWILASWQQHIIPLLNSDSSFQEYVIKMLHTILDSEYLKSDEKTETVLYHLHVFYYLLKENRINSIDFLQALNEKVYAQIELTKKENKIKNENSKNDKIDSTVELIRRNGGLNKTTTNG